MGGLSPLCPQPRGDLVLRSPARSSRGKPQPCESCPEQQSPYACKRVIFLFCRQLVWTHLSGHLPDFLSAGRGACSFHPDPATAAGTLARCSVLSLKSV